MPISWCIAHSIVTDFGPALLLDDMNGAASMHSEIETPAQLLFLQCRKTAILTVLCASFQ